MNDEDGRPPEVGSLHEETLRLLGALGEWAREGDQTSEHTGDQPEARPEGSAGSAGSEGSAGHGSTADCRFCPVCQVIHVVRSTSPEVREHLATAATALLQAASELMATHVPRSDAPGSDGANGAAVEKIDLDADDLADPS